MHKLDDLIEMLTEMHELFEGIEATQMTGVELAKLRFFRDVTEHIETAYQELMNQPKPQPERLPTRDTTTASDIVTGITQLFK